MTEFCYVVRDKDNNIMFKRTQSAKAEAFFDTKEDAEDFLKRNYDPKYKDEGYHVEKLESPINY
jgi:hypothetical protein